MLGAITKTTDISTILDKQTQDILDIFDEVFRQLRQPPLLENPIFKPDNSWTDSFGSCFRTDKQDNKIDLLFFIGNFGVEFHIDRTSEMPCLSYEFIQNNGEAFRQVLVDIFTSHIETEYKGSKTVLRFFDNNDKQKKELTFYRGISLNFLYKSEYKRYKPIFSVDSFVG